MITRSRALAVLVGLVASIAVPASADASSASRSADAFRAARGTPPATHAGHPRQVDPRRFHAFTVDHATLGAVLDDAPAARPTARRGGAALTVTLPGPDGANRRFAVQESPVLDAELAAAHPEIRTFAGVGVDDPAATVRMDLTPLGLHASVRGPEGLWYVDPYYRGDRSLYAAYRREDLGPSVHGPLIEPESVLDREAVAPFLGAAPRAGDSVTQHTYRLALVTDPTYAAYFGAENVVAAKTTLIDRVNQIYNDDVAVHLQLADATVPEGSDVGQDPSGDALNLDTVAEMYAPNGPCGAAPCYPVADPSQVSCGDVLDANFTAIPQLMRGKEFDIGHIALGTAGGGVAELSAVGTTTKAIGCTGIPTPVGDYFAVDYVAHEMGHQFGGNHTFAGTQNNCEGSNRNDLPGSEGPSARGTAVEPGSGTSVMAYAGICDSDNLQPHSDPYFSQRSIDEIVNHTARSYPAVGEIQTVSLRAFDAGDAFALRNGSQTSSAIPFGPGYTAAAIESALAGIGIPGATVTPYGDADVLGPEGFSVEFGDTVDHPLLEVVPADPVAGDVTGFSGETVKGGVPTNQGTAVLTSNRAPTVTAPATATVPLRTPFTLAGGGSDLDGDALSYLWEQNDPSKPGGTSLVSNTKVSGPLFRLFGRRAAVTDADALTSPSPGRNVATADASRTFPDLAQILAGNTNAATGACPETTATGKKSDPVPTDIVECFAEFLPTQDYLGGTGASRLLHFRLTARDGHAGGGGTGHADTTVRIDPAAGPFLVTSQATPSSAAAGGPLTVTWDRANTDDATTNAQNVRILLSTDGGTTFGTVLAASTPNDDAQTVTLPADAQTAAARIKVEAVGGVFFDVSDAPLTITAPDPVTGAPTPTTPAPTTPPAGPAAPPAPGPAPGRTPEAGLRPSLAGQASRVRLTAAGRMRVRVRCVPVGAGVAPTRCTGTVRVTARVGRRTVTIATATVRGARTGTTVAVRLTARGRRLAARPTGVAARVTVSVRTGGKARTATKAVRVLRAR